MAPALYLGVIGMIHGELSEHSFSCFPHFILAVSGFELPEHAPLPPAHPNIL
jgi:hypothetical protein